MKKIFLALCVFATVGLSAAPANEETKVDPRVKAVFQKEFSYASNVKWIINKNGSLFTALFSLGDEGFAAYFSADAELIGVARNLLYNQLPLAVTRNLDLSYPGAEIYGISEFNSHDETNYFMEATYKNKKFLLKASPSGVITRIKKIKE